MDGFSEYAESSIDKIGSNVMYITKWEMSTDFDNLTEAERRRGGVLLLVHEVPRRVPGGRHSPGTRDAARQVRRFGR